MHWVGGWVAARAVSASYIVARSACKIRCSRAACGRRAGRHVAPQLNVVLAEKHHTDSLKGAPDGVGRNRVRLPTFQLEIVDCALAH
jgi:hypothetical protein